MLMPTGALTTVFHIPFVKSLSVDFALVTILERKATAEHSEARNAFPDVKVVNSMCVSISCFFTGNS